jgi:PPK2 family polyphosphate:nucleotide phosphotransferase
MIHNKTKIPQFTSLSFFIIRRKGQKSVSEQINFFILCVNQSTVMGKILLKEISTRAPKDFDKERTKKKTAEILYELDDLQNLLFAEGKHSVLVVLQGMDASGKDGVIRNVFGSLNPQGVTVKSFKAPTPEELSRDFLWRVHNATPGKGVIQLFNRSHYEDILITRVYGWCDDKTAQKRMKAINDFENLLQEHNNTHILKFYLHISPEEQHGRLMERMKDPAKMWKYNENDFEQAKRWDAYMKAYEACFENCNNVSWTIVPADQNWYKEYVIASALYDLLKGLDMKFPGLKK